MDKIIDKEVVSNRLKELSAKKSLTQLQVAQVIGLDRSTIGKYETGVNIPCIPILIKLAKFFVVSSDYLLGCYKRS